jgi:hypothetical protein
MASSLRWTTADLEAMPDDGERYEIIDGELHVSEQPEFDHQRVGGRERGALSAGAFRRAMEGHGRAWTPNAQRVVHHTPTR